MTPDARPARILDRFGALLLFATAACSSTMTGPVKVAAIANENEEPVACAVLVDGVVQKDAGGALVQTPATIEVTFREDPTGAHPYLPVTIGVLALLDEHGALRLPDADAAEAPPYGYAERPMRPTDTRNQLFIVVRNADKKVFRIPKGNRAPTQ